MLWKFGILGAVLLAIWLWSYMSCRSWPIVLSILLGFLTGIIIYESDPSSVERRRAQAEFRQAQERADMQPRVIREVDGCKVYSFKSGERWHYFTRCPNSQTTTESSWEECKNFTEGKRTSRKCEIKTESIDTRS